MFVGCLSIVFRVLYALSLSLSTIYEWVVVPSDYPARTFDTSAGMGHVTMFNRVDPYSIEDPLRCAAMLSMQRTEKRETYMRRILQCIYRQRFRFRLNTTCTV